MRGEAERRQPLVKVKNSKQAGNAPQLGDITDETAVNEVLCMIPLAAVRKWNVR